MKIGDHVEKIRTGKFGTIKNLGRVWLTVRPHDKSRKELWRRDEVRPPEYHHPDNCEHPHCDLPF